MKGRMRWIYFSFHQEDITVIDSVEESKIMLHLKPSTCRKRGERRRRTEKKTWARRWAWKKNISFSLTVRARNWSWMFHWKFFFTVQVSISNWMRTAHSIHHKARILRWFPISVIFYATRHGNLFCSSQLLSLVELLVVVVNACRLDRCCNEQKNTGSKRINELEILLFKDKSTKASMNEKLFFGPAIFFPFIQEVLHLPHLKSLNAALKFFPIKSFTTTLLYGYCPETRPLKQFRKSSVHLGSFSSNFLLSLSLTFFHLKANLDLAESSIFSRIHFRHRN